MPLNWASVFGTTVGGLIPIFIVYLLARLVLRRWISPFHASVTGALIAWLCCGVVAYSITGHLNETRNAELWLAYFLAACVVGGVGAVRASGERDADERREPDSRPSGDPDDDDDHDDRPESGARLPVVRKRAASLAPARTAEVAGDERRERDPGASPAGAPQPPAPIASSGLLLWAAIGVGAAGVVTAVYAMNIADHALDQAQYAARAAETAEARAEQAIAAAERAQADALSLAEELDRRGRSRR